jgi:hypothetical protein
MSSIKLRRAEAISHKDISVQTEESEDVQAMCTSQLRLSHTTATGKACSLECATSSWAAARRVSYNL